LQKIGSKGKFKKLRKLNLKQSWWWAESEGGESIVEGINRLPAPLRVVEMTLGGLRPAARGGTKFIYLPTLLHVVARAPRGESACDVQKRPCELLGNSPRTCGTLSHLWTTRFFVTLNAVAIYLQFHGMLMLFEETLTVVLWEHERIRHKIEVDVPPSLVLSRHVARLKKDQKATRKTQPHQAHN
jgi:hypothetical protein